MRRRRDPEVIAGRVQADGTILSGEGFTVNRLAAGQYVILIPNFKLLGVTAQAMTWASGEQTLVDLNALTFRVVCYTAAGGSVDKAFMFVAVGQQQ